MELHNLQRGTPHREERTHSDVGVSSYGSCVKPLVVLFKVPVWVTPSTSRQNFL